ncbi:MULTISPECIES: ROK family protein [Providencia]|uniref:ROK family protein n=1 Tax=Providencia TaxID=586 RepID=UPI001981E5D4|nr:MULTISPECIES: ROK family protein [Providencia]MBN4866740.1 ROK family protein [Providencia stuartii]MBN4875988.1 ROK family protein [Providencia stuartii]MBN4880754.1 ROK family protein [Providencia stuartii]MBN4885188.1 ROK family protein [Providencia stuartii]
MLNQTGHIDQIKQLNTGIVYRIIDQHGPISRIALSKQASLAPASITKITRELMDAHLIKELEFPVLGLRGRPAIGLVIESEGWQFLSMVIEPRKITVSLKEINGVTLAQNTYPFDVCGNDAFIHELLELISQFFADHQMLIERLTAISILAEGIIDPYQGIVFQLTGFNINSLPIAQHLTKQTGLPVYLHSTVDALALMDHFSLSAKRQATNIIYLQVQDVVNATVLNRGVTLDANTQKPLLFGHSQLGESNQVACYCGGEGCLETHISIPVVLQKASNLSCHYPDSVLLQNEISIDKICAGAILGDPLCVYLIEMVAKQLAKPLSLMVSLFGTELILINSPLNIASERLFARLHHYIHQYASPLYSSHLLIEKSNFSVKESESTLIQRALYDGSLLLQLLQG